MKMTAPAPARTEAEQETAISYTQPNYKKVTVFSDAELIDQIKDVLKDAKDILRETETVYRQHKKYIRPGSEYEREKKLTKLCKMGIVYRHSHTFASEKDIIRRISKTAPKVNIFRRQGAV